MSLGIECFSTRLRVTPALPGEAAFELLTALAAPSDQPAVSSQMLRGRVQLGAAPAVLLARKLARPWFALVPAVRNAHAAPCCRRNPALTSSGSSRRLLATPPAFGPMPR